MTLSLKFSFWSGRPSFLLEWNIIDSHIYNSYVHRIPLDSSVQLHDEWLTPPELEERVRAKEQQAKIWGTFNMSSSKPSQDISATKWSLTPKSQDDSLPSQDKLTATDDNSLSKFVNTAEFSSELPDATDIHHDSHQVPCRNNRLNKVLLSSCRLINEVFLSSLED